MISDALLHFIWSHRTSDPYSLAFQRDTYEGFDFAQALSALKARQKLARKIPEWAEIPQLFIPSEVMVEQASSWETALHKSRFVKATEWKVLDLSGGLGVDSYAFAQRAKEVHYLELDPLRVDVARHNFQALQAPHITTHQGRAEEEGLQLAHTLQPQLIYMDPDRRAKEGGIRSFLLEHSSPNILTLIPQLKEVAPSAHLLIKLSPMMDLEYLYRTLPCPFDTYLISLHRELKELLLYLHPQAEYQLEAVELGKKSSYILHGARQIDQPITYQDEVGSYLYDLYPSIGKAGLQHFDLSSSRHSTPSFWAPDPHTHLFFSNHWIPDFPGRHFEVLQHNHGDRRWLRDLCKSPLHLIVKNRPISTDRLRKDLKITEGGTQFLITYDDASSTTHYLLAHRRQ